MADFYTRRQAHSVVNGLTLYRVKLRGGPGDGQESLCSHDTVWHGGEKYVRAPDDYYDWEPQAGGKN